jgi:hypothetical protein
LPDPDLSRVRQEGHRPAGRQPPSKTGGGRPSSIVYRVSWLPDVIMVKQNAFSPELKKQLEAMGHRFREVQSIAKVKAIQVLEDGRGTAVDCFQRRLTDALLTDASLTDAALTACPVHVVS